MSRDIALVLRARNRTYRRMCREESRDTDADGVPDVYEHDEDRATYRGAG